MKALFISYDGMTDPLGRSQVIPYLQGLARCGHKIFLLSCEKPDRYAKSGKEVAELLRDSKISWKHIPYQGKPKFLGPLGNKMRLKRAAISWHLQERFDLVHCRSHLPSLIGRHLQKRFGVPFIFDMRGFWADERVDGGIWPQNHFLYRVVYNYFKRKERSLLRQCNYVVTLTHRAKEIILGWNLSLKSERIEVIPCCADLDHFDYGKVEERRATLLRESLDISDKNKVIGYLGSVGTWYLLSEMMRFFRVLHAMKPHWKFLFVTHDSSEEILRVALKEGVDPSALIIQPASREEVPLYVSLFDVGLFFIQPVFSKQASSATKFAELLAMGKPVITNSGVGDNDFFLSKYKIGFSVKNFGETELTEVASRIEELEKVEKRTLREVAEREFSLELALMRYGRIYSSFDSSQENIRLRQVSGALQPG
jgi:glycosyltransferase involved in cell wall biosynthesis